MLRDIRSWPGLVVLAILAAGCGVDPPAPSAGETFCKTANCDDKNPCTADSCDPKAGKCENKPDEGKSCDDSDKCTVDDACKAAKCEGKAKTCSDDDVCTLGDKCNQDDGKCVPGKAKDCDDGNKCTTDTCDPVEGCKNKANSDACDDNDACTTNDKCTDKACKGAAVATDDGDPCTTDACTASGGVTHVANTADCDDKNPCTVGDKCADKKCVGGAAKTCEDSNACTDDSCDAATGNCKFVNNTKACDDGSACTKDDTCDAGACKGAAVKTDDGNPCTDDDCDKKAGPTHVANTAACEDGKVCTVGDKCADKTCVSGPAKYCDEIDGNACTVPQCIEGAGGCKEVKVKDDTPCNDNDKCTSDDKCGNGVCLAGTVTPCTGDGNVCKDWACDPKNGCTFKPAQKGKTCEDGDACTKSDTCDAGACLPGQLATCQDGNPCTDDSCNPKSGCQYLANSQPCDDKDACTVGDMCKSSACAPGTVTTCDDKNPCTIDQCDKLTGKCGTQAATEGTPCEDASLCTNDTVCKIGQCTGGTKVVCQSDGNPCTSDACSDATGCKYPAQDGPCDADGSVCTPKDYCSAGKCVADSIKSCDDGNPCTDDVCDKLKDCLNTPNSAKCDDGLLCTVGDTCKGGACSVSTAKNCSDGNDCTEDTCDNKTGCGSVNSLPGSSCSDGDACSTGDGCDGKGVCKATGKALWVKKEGTALQDSYFAATAGSDGTIVAAGRSYTGKDTFSPLFVGTSSDGTQKFSAKVTNGGPHAQFLDVTTTSTGAFVAVGANDPASLGYPNHAYAVQIVSTGKIDWENDGMVTGVTESYARGVAARPAGGVVVVGSSYPSGAYYRGFLTELDAAGKVAGVQSAYNPTSPYSGQYFTDVAVAPAGGYWVAGIALQASCGVQHVLRIQDSGSVIFDKYLTTPDGKHYEDTNKLIADKDGVTVFGQGEYGPYGNDDAFVARVDNNGTVVYKVYLGTAGFDGFRDAVPLTGGGFLVSGYWTSSGAQPDTMQAMLASVTASGQLVWQRTFNELPSYWRGIALLPNGRVAVAGHTSFQTVGDADTLLASCDLYGNCDCASSGTCLTKAPADCDDKNPCSLDWCDKGVCQHAIGNEGLTCGTNQTCQKGKCL